ncbi:MAG: hypothetical protein NVS9B9_30050 [Ktedonobacteraceae bacterium]
MMQNAESDREILTMPDADVVFYRNYFSASESDTLFQELTLRSKGNRLELTQGIESRM